MWLQILYNQQSVEVPGNLKRKLITHLQPDTDYSFVLMSRGNSAGGLQQQVSIRTAPDLLKMKPAPYQQDVEEGGKVTVSLPRVPAGAPVRSASAFCLSEGKPLLFEAFILLYSSLCITSCS